MTDKKVLNPDYIFEVSWEICNKVGGIYTVISTKVQNLVNDYNDNYILIGPDVWKETTDHPEFTEDKKLYSSWRKKAEETGLNFKIGRWNIVGNPVVILVDFTTFFPTKDEIFTEFWNEFKLDSLPGQWDYIEPSMFGYAAAKIIESFYEYNISYKDKIVAHFHEWLTGTGVLYLKSNIQQIGTIFTTHATVLGRTIASNNLPLYDNMQDYDGDIIAARYGVKAKYSLEKNAAHHADCFTTVSIITSNECKYLLNKEVDIVTPNGFDDSFVPGNDIFTGKRKTARDKLLAVTKTFLNQNISENCLFIINSGRYEYKNKGIDIFIDALGKLNSDGNLQKEIIAFITVPTSHSGVNPALLGRLNNSDYDNPIIDEYLTHNLHYPLNDPILHSIRKNHLRNLPEDKVKIIFVPCYLNGSDGFINLDYYDLLIGFDLSVFPSYYEPWGYTPLESLAFSIPTVTTSLAGFGRWIKDKYKDFEKGAFVVERNEDNNNEVRDEIVNIISDIASCTDNEMGKIRDKAFKISRIALWDKMITNYKDAYSTVLEKVEKRSGQFRSKIRYNQIYLNNNGKNNIPVWKKVFVKPVIPEKFKGLQRIAYNLWWTWNYEASELFEKINKNLWEKLEHNPVAFLESLFFDQFQKLENDQQLIEDLTSLTENFNNYIDTAKTNEGEKIAYFSMEYGLHDSIKTYSGGLGILAGDYLKQASDSNKNVVGIGLLYRYGYIDQKISLTGDQLAVYSPQRFTHLPIQPVRDNNGKWIKIGISLPGRILYAKAWRIDIGRIPLYLLDTDIDENSEQERSITHQLYGGDKHYRFKQELLLGVGGVRLLDALGIKADVFHCNEGHAAFVGIERLKKYIQDKNFSFDQAIELVRASSLFTTHTPVPAGHDIFSEELIRTYIPHYANRLKIPWDKFMGLGRFSEDDRNEEFSLSVLAAKLSQEMNGVSKIHGGVSCEMFNKLYDGFFKEELHIGYVTNGVHFPTWVAKEWKILFEEVLGEDFDNSFHGPKKWENIFNVPDNRIWGIRKKLKKDLITFLKRRITENMTRRQENPKHIIKTVAAFDEDTLIVGFARRFTPYKRAHLMFYNEERLAKIVNNSDKPVHFIFAGKAHPQDKQGQDLIKKVVEYSKKPEFIGKITFIENYNIEIAKKLLQGVDVWLNTPTRPLEASGTSGEKALFNGVLNFSVLDGWWAEGYVEGAGWAFNEKRTYENQEFQNQLDAEIFYNILEEEIIPLFYSRNDRDVPLNWISYIKKSIAHIAPNYTTIRMIDEYYSKLYSKLYNRSKLLIENDYEKMGQLTSWKELIINTWDKIRVLSVEIPDSNKKPLMTGKRFISKIILETNGLDKDDIGVEIIFSRKRNNIFVKILHKEELHVVDFNERSVTFACDISVTGAGVYDFIFRVFPKNELLPHRQDFNMVMWIYKICLFCFLCGKNEFCKGLTIFTLVL